MIVRQSFYFQQGNDAYFRGDFGGAIAAYDQALFFKPDDHEALYNKGVSLDNLGRYEAAIAAYDQALSFKPDDHEALFNKGVSLYNLGRYEAAIAAYDQALSFKPDLHEALYNKGVSLSNLGRYEAAIAAYDQALSFKPDFHEALYNKGLSLANLGRYEAAIAAYDQALSFKPDLHEALYNKGVSLDNLGRYEAAIAAYDQALSFKPDDHEALYNKGVSLDNLGRYEAAIAAYDQALSFKPDDHEAWLNRGSAAFSSPRCHTPVAFSLPSHCNTNHSISVVATKPKLPATSSASSTSPNTKTQKAGANSITTQAAPTTSTVASSLMPSATSTKPLTLTKQPSPPSPPSPHAISPFYKMPSAPTSASTASEMANQCREQGANIFDQLLNQALTPAAKRRLDTKFSGFSQLQVDTFIATKSYTTALKTAERHKNRTLMWLLDTWQETTTIPSWVDMQSLLNPSTAAIYWHLSPDSLTTFLLTTNASAPVAFTQPTATLESWLKKWNQQYQAYRGKGKAAEASKDFDTWRTSLQSSLDELKTILKISELEASLQDVSQLLLIPHRDLHCLPLHALFSDSFTISHLPSLQVGLNLKQRAVSTTPRADLPLLTIADPAGDTLRLESAQIESTLISQLFNQVDTVKSSNATTQTVTTKLLQPNRIFNFSGHAWAERQPEQSALYLQGEDRLTAEAICHLKPNPYDLITLSACETAVTGLQTIESDYVGLVSAFLTAGAANIISTLWTVESESNAWLMVKFYQHYVAGDSPAVALKKAQHWLRTLTYADLANWLQAQQNQLDSRIHANTYDAIAARIGDIQSDPSKIESENPYADPYYWAAFTVTGYLS